jgi:hypothetical protein
VRFRDIIDSDFGPHHPLDLAMARLGAYIRDNATEDLRAISEVFHSHGYRETVQGGRFFRVIFHDVTEADRGLGSLSALHERLKQEVRFEMTGGRRKGEGFCRTLALAERFVEQTLHTSGRTPDHYPGADPASLDQVIVIYEVTAPSSAILLSMEGVQRFLKQTPPTGAWKALNYALNDMWDGYGHDDEVIIDTTQVEIIDVHLYDTQARSLD